MLVMIKRFENVTSSSSVYFPQNVITVYDSNNRIEPKKRLDTSLYIRSVIAQNVNNLFVYLKYGQTCYIDVSLSTNNLTSLKIKIESINFNYVVDLNSGDSYNIMTDEAEIGDKLKN